MTRKLISKALLSVFVIALLFGAVAPAFAAHTYVVCVFDPYNGTSADEDICDQLFFTPECVWDNIWSNIEGTIFYAGFVCTYGFIPPWEEGETPEQPEVEATVNRPSVPLVSPSIARWFVQNMHKVNVLVDGIYDEVTDGAGNIWRVEVMSGMLLLVEIVHKPEGDILENSVVGFDPTNNFSELFYWDTPRSS